MSSEWKVICTGHNLLKLFWAYRQGLVSRDALRRIGRLTSKCLFFLSIHDNHPVIICFFPHLWLCS